MRQPVLLLLLLCICVFVVPSWGYCSFNFTNRWITASFSTSKGLTFGNLRKNGSTVYLFGGGSELFKTTTDALFRNWSILSGIFNFVQLLLDALTKAVDPVARFGAISWMENNRFMLLGGMTYFIDGSNSVLGDFWSRGPLGWKRLLPIIGLVGPYKNVPPVFTDVAAAPGSNAFGFHAQDETTKDFYLFGGLYYTSKTMLSNNVFVRRNAKWKFLDGSQYAGNVDNDLTIPRPAGRMKGCLWTVSGGFWIYGGQKPNGNGYIENNEVWYFNETAAKWTFYDMTGRVNVSDPSQIGKYSPILAPPARFGCTCWSDHLGQHWLYGGQNGAGQIYGDLWSFDPATLQWAFWWPVETANMSVTDIPGMGPPAIGSRYGSLNLWDSDALTITIFGGLTRSGLASGGLTLSGDAFSANFTCDNITIRLPTLPPLKTIILPTLPPWRSPTASPTAPATVTSTPLLPTGSSSSSAASSSSSASTQPSTTSAQTFNFVPPVVTSPIVIISDGNILSVNRSLLIQLNSLSSPVSQVQVQGCMNLGGDLEIQLTQEPQYNVSVPLITTDSNCLNGTFHQIRISANYTDRLSNQTTNCVPQYETVQTQNSFAVIFVAPKKGCSSSSSGKKSLPRYVIAIAVLASLFLVVVLIVAIVLLRKYGYLKWFARSTEKVKSGGEINATAATSYVLLKEGGTDAL